MLIFIASSNINGIKMKYKFYNINQCTGAHIPVRQCIKWRHPSNAWSADPGAMIIGVMITFFI